MFKLHLKRSHGVTLKEYVIKHEHEGVHPTCACGCGLPVSWRQDAYFMRLVHGHVTDEIRTAQRDKRLGKKASEQTRLRQSQAMSDFFVTPMGQSAVAKRAASLRAFHESPAGIEWSEQQSEKLKRFNATIEGRRIRAEVGKKISEAWKNDPARVENMKEKLRQHWASDEGKRTLSARSARLSAFYVSPEGRTVIDGMRQKIREKLLMSENDFNDRLSVVTETFNVLSTLPTYDLYQGFKTFGIDVVVSCKKSGHQMTRRLVNLINIPNCLICTARFSRPQHDVADFVRSLGVDVTVNDRSIISPKEIDVFVHEHMFGIEFNGLYWHCELNASSKQHVEEKHLEAKARNVRLLTIFEDEWRLRRHIIEGVIRCRLGMGTRVGARTLSPVQLMPDQRRSFFDDCHLEGDVTSSVAFGLVNEAGDLISALSLRRPFHASERHFAEISRFATLPGVIVIGGLSRLLVKAKEWARASGCDGLLSYVDNRFGDGHGYAACGFKLVRRTQPRFWWTDLHERFDRFTYRARQKQGLTQAQVASAAGVYRIWGAGNLVYVMDVKSTT